MIWFETTGIFICYVVILYKLLTSASLAHETEAVELEVEPSVRKIHPIIMKYGISGLSVYILLLIWIYGMDGLELFK